jgi:hypothetical protein
MNKLLQRKLVWIISKQVPVQAGIMPWCIPLQIQESLAFTTAQTGQLAVHAIQDETQCSKPYPMLPIVLRENAPV